MKRPIILLLFFCVGCARETRFELPTPPGFLVETGTEVLAEHNGFPTSRPSVQVLGGDNKTIEVTITGRSTLTAIVYEASPETLGLPVGKLEQAYGEDAAPLPSGGIVYTLDVESESSPDEWTPSALPQALIDFRYRREPEPELCGAFVPGAIQGVEGDRIIALLPEHEGSALLVAGQGDATLVFRVRAGSAERIGPPIPSDVAILDASMSPEWLYLAGRTRTSSTAALLRLPRDTFDAIERVPMPGPGLRAVASVGETEDTFEQAAMYALDDDGQVVRLVPMGGADTSTQTIARLPRHGPYPHGAPGQLVWMNVKSLFVVSPHHTSVYGVSGDGMIYERSPNRRACSIERFQKSESGLRVGTRCGEVYRGSALERIGPLTYGSPVLDQMPWGRGALAIQDNSVVQFRKDDTCAPIASPEGTTLLRILPLDQLSIFVAGTTLGPRGEPMLFASVWAR